MNYITGLMRWLHIAPPPPLPEAPKFDHQQITRQRVAEALASLCPVAALHGVIASYASHPSDEIRSSLTMHTSVPGASNTPIFRAMALPLEHVDYLRSFQSHAFGINLNGVPLGASLLGQLRRACPQATELHLRGCSLTIDLNGQTGALAEIIQLRALHVLDLSYNILHVDGTVDQDEEDAVGEVAYPFVAFKSLESLRVLRLEGVFRRVLPNATPPHPDNLEGLQNLPNLTELNVSNNPEVGTLDQVEMFLGFPKLQRLIVKSCPQLHAQFAQRLAPQIAVISE